ncbi:MAG: hypothetical protein QOH39_3028 [Verrucomicrobiota bacterium]|jgi:hypothetical protein
MNLDQVKKSFHGTKRGHGSERHNVKSLSRRLMLPREGVRKLLKGGHLQFEQQFSAGKNGSTYEFKSAHLDAVREQVVDQLISDIHARLAGLDLNEQEEAIAALQGLRTHRAEVDHEFSSKPNDPDEDDNNDNNNDVAKVVGGVGGAIEGATIAGGLGGGTLGLVGGAVGGGAIGEQAGAGSKIAGVAAAGGLGYLAHNAILGAGGYAQVAKKTGVAGSDLWNAVRGMLATTAKAEI